MARCAASISSGVWGVLKSEQQECETGVSQFFHNSLSFSWLVFICGFGLQGTRGIWREVTRKVQKKISPWIQMVRTACDS
jgi:hypothetical protein